MDTKNFLRKLSYEIGVSKPVYQKNAGDALDIFLKIPETEKKSYSLTFDRPDATKIKIRAKKNPPSVQIIHSPAGGQKNAQKRVREKLYLQDETAQIVTVNKNDITRETIIMNLKDQTLNEILRAGLMAPEQITSLIKFLHEDHPNLFIVINRFLLGIEPLTKTPVPFKLVEMEDEETWGYINDLICKNV